MADADRNKTHAPKSSTTRPESTTSPNSATRPKSAPALSNPALSPEQDRSLGVVQPCPCGSGATLGACCLPYIERTKRPPTAETLMRSRYSAYTLCDADYLRFTWHSSTRPSRVRFSKDQQWLGLEIRATDAGGPLDTEGTVEFIASYKDNNGTSAIHELSDFVKGDGQWTYVAGVHDPQ